MHWHILGAGSLGCLWAARLAAQQHSVYLIMRTANALAHHQAHPYVALSDPQFLHTQHYPVKAQLAEHPQPIKNLVLACKAYDAQAAIGQVAHRLNSDSLVILLQNGLGSQQAVQSMLPHTRCIAASSTEGAYLAAPLHTVFAGQGHIWLGDIAPSITAAAPAQLASLQAAGIPCSWATDIAPVLWRKLAMNCAINPLTVIYNCLNGQLRHYPAQINTLCDELQRLLCRAGQATAAHNLHQQVWDVIDNTAANSSSMRQDTLQQRRTEISYITGFACAQSLALECETPTLHTIHRQLQKTLLEQGLPTT